MLRYAFLRCCVAIAGHDACERYSFWRWRCFHVAVLCGIDFSMLRVNGTHFRFESSSLRVGEVCSLRVCSSAGPRSRAAMTADDVFEQHCFWT